MQTQINKDIIRKFLARSVMEKILYKESECVNRSKRIDIGIWRWFEKKNCNASPVICMVFGFLFELSQ